MIDRLGPRPVLSVSAVIYPGMLAALVALASSNGRHGWIALAALLAGASFPPITICMRALYPRLLPHPGLLQAAYSVDSALVETLFIVGPVLVALFVAGGYPFGAVLFAAVCAAAGNVIFLRSVAVRNWTVHALGGRRSLLGLLRHSRLLAVLAATVLYSVAFGLYEIAVTAFTANHGTPAAAGVILALASVGSAAGAIVWLTLDTTRNAGDEGRRRKDGLVFTPALRESSFILAPRAAPPRASRLWCCDDPARPCRLRNLRSRCRKRCSRPAWRASPHCASARRCGR